MTITVTSAAFAWLMAAFWSGATQYYANKTDSSLAILVSSFFSTAFSVIMTAALIIEASTK